MGRASLLPFLMFGYQVFKSALCTFSSLPFRRMIHNEGYLSSPEVAALGCPIPAGPWLREFVTQEGTDHTSIPSTTHLTQASVDEERPGLDSRPDGSTRDIATYSHPRSSYYSKYLLILRWRSSRRVVVTTQMTEG